MKNTFCFLFVIMTLLLSACVSDPQRDGKDLNDASNFNAQMGLEYIKQGRYDVALDKLKKAVVQDPENAVAQHY
ncbi:MAG: hypothetical protein ACWGOW_06820, partial [Gammaproteobacteria bacterium]